MPRPYGVVNFVCCGNRKFPPHQSPTVTASPKGGSQLAAEFAKGYKKAPTEYRWGHGLNRILLLRSYLVGIVLAFFVGAGLGTLSQHDTRNVTVGVILNHNIADAVLQFVACSF